MLAASYHGDRSMIFHQSWCLSAAVTDSDNRLITGTHDNVLAASYRGERKQHYFSSIVMPQCSGHSYRQLITGTPWSRENHFACTCSAPYSSGHKLLATSAPGDFSLSCHDFFLLVTRCHRNKNNPGQEKTTMLVPAVPHIALAMSCWGHQFAGIFHCQAMTS